MDKDPFGYSVLTYMWVVGLSAFASIIRYLNNMQKFSLGQFFLDALSGGFTGLLTFWLCESSGISGPLSAFLIGVSGLMGSRAWQEFANMLRLKFGLKALHQEEEHTSYEWRPVNSVPPFGGLPPGYELRPIRKEEHESGKVNKDYLNGSSSPFPDKETDSTDEEKVRPTNKTQVGEQK